MASFKLNHHVLVVPLSSSNFSNTKKQVWQGKTTTTTTTNTNTCQAEVCRMLSTTCWWLGCSQHMHHWSLRTKVEGPGSNFYGWKWYIMSFVCWYFFHCRWPRHIKLIELNLFKRKTMRKLKAGFSCESSVEANGKENCICWHCWAFLLLQLFHDAFPI